LTKAPLSTDGGELKFGIGRGRKAEGQRAIPLPGGVEGTSLRITSEKGELRLSCK